MTKNRVSVHFDIHTETARELKELAAADKTTQTATLERLIRDTYYQQTVDPNVLLVRLDRQNKRLDVIQKQLDTLGGVFLSSLSYVLAGLPELRKTGDAAQTAFRSGEFFKGKVIQTYLTKLKKTPLTFLQSIWGDPGVEEDIR